jgi:hypothetical protein
LAFDRQKFILSSFRIFCRLLIDFSSFFISFGRGQDNNILLPDQELFGLLLMHHLTPGKPCFFSTKKWLESRADAKIGFHLFLSVKLVSQQSLLPAEALHHQSRKSSRQY